MSIMKKSRFIPLSICILLFAFLGVSMQLQAATPTYTMSKGKATKLSVVMNKHPLIDCKYKYKYLRWRSSKPAIVSISKHGVLRAKRKGRTLIKGYYKKRHVLSFFIQVGTPVKKISVNKKSLTFFVYDNPVQVKASVSPANASISKYTFVSENTSVCKVSKKGVITPVRGGETKVVVYANDGNAKAKISVKVYNRTFQNTEQGMVHGITKNDSLVWYGIYYGADTSGANRWKAPKDPPTWNGVAQKTSKKPGAACYGDGTSFSGTENCLYVNISRPNTSEKNLPVLVYLHGGGNASGNANIDFSKMAKGMNVVIVSVEYRLGAFGFLSHPALRDGTPEEKSGNFTMLDIKKALQWVRANVKYFGGNPSSVTLSGYSAGARDVMFCLISPIMKGLFDRAITFSGGGATCTNKEGEESLEKKLANILVKRGKYEKYADAYQYVTHSEAKVIRELLNSLSTAEVANMYSSPSLRLSLFPQGFHDGVVIHKDGFNAIEKGEYNRVPLILGSNMTEFSTFAWTSKYTIFPDDEERYGMNSDRFLRNAIYYGSKLQSYHYIEEPAAMIRSDFLGKNVYAYRFNWGSNTTLHNADYRELLGSHHGMDVQFLLGNFTNKYPQYANSPYNDDNKKGRMDLRDTMRRYLRNFMVKGNPNETGLVNWDPWTESLTNPVMVFDADRNYDCSIMRNIRYNQEEIFEEMKKNLNEESYQAMIDNPFNGRFFMPWYVPKYKNNENM